MRHKADVEEQRRILVVEDDVDLLASIDDCLTAAGYAVAGVTNGLRAQEVLENYTFDLILSDWRVPDFGGIDLLCFVRQFEKTPFILMTGFTDFIAQGDIYQSGASGFLPKPFNQEDLILTISTCLKSAEEKRNLDNEFTKIETSQIRSESTLSADLFLRMSAENYVKVATKDSFVSTERLKSHIAKGLKYLYVRNTDLSHFFSINFDPKETETKPRTASSEVTPALKVLSGNPELLDLVNRHYGPTKR